MKTRYNVQAVLDLEDAFEYYSLRSHDLAADFLDAVEQAVADAVKHPARFPVYEAATFDVELRRVPVRRFPHYVVYQISPDGITIVAVAHPAREPGYWMKDQS